MIAKLDNKNEKMGAEIIELQKASYRIEADMIGFESLPPLLETKDDIKQSEESYFGYFEGSELAGIVSFKAYGSTLDIYKVVVHPRHFRKGIARQLLGYLERNFDADRIIVSTALKNTPAITLYKALGFCEIMRHQVEDGLVIVDFEKFLC